MKQLSDQEDNAARIKAYKRWVHQATLNKLNPREEDTVEVPRKWLRTLMQSSAKLSGKYVTIESEDKDQIQFMTQLAHLQGYIESAKYILKEDS